MQREEKQLELSIETLVSRLTELKNQLNRLLYKIEHEGNTHPWPSLLNNFALIAAELSSVSKAVSNDKVPPLRNLAVLPLLLSQDRDEELFQLTERRMPVFSHDLVPDYLRTKPEPEIEVKIHQLLNKANGVAYDTAQKQITAFNKVITHVLEIVNKSKEEWESEAGSRNGIGQTSLQQDTYALVSAVSMGKGVKPMVPQGVGGGPGMLVPPGGRPGGPGPAGAGAGGSQNNPIAPNQGQVNMMGKAPSSIKTNIKPASQLHPFR